MRKLNNVSKENNNTLAGIVNVCSCVAVCMYGVNKKTETDLQKQYAHTGTMPQGGTDLF